jgi:arylsulfatase A-like enzyme
LIEKDRQTIATVLKSAGYQTACVGKWHLGLGWQWNDAPPPDINNMGMVGGKPKLVNYSKPLTHGPTTLGFDQCLIIPASLDMSPYVYIRDDRVTAIPDNTVQASQFPAFYRKGEIAPDFKFPDVLDQLTREACRIVKDKAAGKDPFFLYFALSAPHKPVMPHPRFKDKTKLGPYGDFVAQVDWTVGEVLRTLDESNIADNTLLIVTSDNGSFMNRLPNTPVDHAQDSTVHGYHPDTHLANGPFRGTKADIWEAGHRVPFIVRWPARIKSNLKSNLTICHTDILATVADAANAKFDRKSAEDSFSFLPTLIGAESESRLAIIHQSGNGQLAIRSGNLKLILGSGSGGREKPVGKPFEQPYQLFDLASDAAETNNLMPSSADSNRLLEAFEKIAHDDHLAGRVK